MDNKTEKPNFFIAKTEKPKIPTPSREGRAFLTFFPRKSGGWAYGMN